MPIKRGVTNLAIVYRKQMNRPMSILAYYDQGRRSRFILIIIIITESRGVQNKVSFYSAHLECLLERVAQLICDF